MTVLSNVSLFYPNASMVFSTQSAYTGFELYYAVIALFAIFMISSLWLDGTRYPFEKIMSSIMAFIFAFSNALASFTLAIIKVENAGFVQQTGVGATIATQQQALVPTIIMQNTITWQVASWILVVLCFLNVINAVIVLLDYTRETGVKKSAI